MEVLHSNTSAYRDTSYEMPGGARCSAKQCREPCQQNEIARSLRDLNLIGQSVTAKRQCMMDKTV